MIYLDHNATTPVASEAAQAMAPFWGPEFGNPSSDYDLGRQARAGLEKGRSRVADLLGAAPDEILFTSGGTESNNAVLKGLFYRSRRPVHLVTTNIEHPAIINPCIFLMTQGAEVAFVPVDGQGLVDPDDVRRVLKPETALVSVMLANNETGVIQPVEEISRIVRERNIRLHTDAAQAVGKIEVDVNHLGVDFLSLAGHKLYAPKGVGALFIRRGLELEPLVHGAGQESGRRAGTENVGLAVGLGAACTLAAAGLTEEAKRQAGLRDHLLDLLQAAIPELVLVGHPTRRLPNTLNLCFPGLVGSEILSLAPEVRASTGAACHAGSVKISPVLQNMGLDPHVAQGAIRLSLGRGTTSEQIEEAAAVLIRAVRELKPGRR